ncbi:MAG: hypothetical protein CM15mP22_3320 [Gammaproteobacteria bacterium]|nr:MAG: hypothetical protein CM15mP22_3320 [Gammaproteobacteria bacterium]
MIRIILIAAFVLVTVLIIGNFLANRNQNSRESSVIY